MTDRQRNRETEKQTFAFVQSLLGTEKGFPQYKTFVLKIKIEEKSNVFTRNYFFRNTVQAFGNILAKNKYEEVEQVLKTCFDIINNSNFCDENYPNKRNAHFIQNATVSSVFYIGMKSKICR